MNVARARRRWLRWGRYIDHLAALGEGVLCPPGGMRAHNERAHRHNAIQNRRQP